MPNKKTSTEKPSHVRIIAGKWRSRHISFPTLPGLRPTQDHIRETLFNWLAPHLEGSVCLDLFAGTGALGFEALSRGAAKVIFIDRQFELVKNLQNNAKNLEATNAEIISGDFPEHMPQFRASQFDIVFMDPPFHKNLVVPSIEWLEHHHYLNKNALIYIEMEHDLELSVPTHWQLLKEGKTSKVKFNLYRC